MSLHYVHILTDCTRIYTHIDMSTLQLFMLKSGSSTDNMSTVFLPDSDDMRSKWAAACTRFGYNDRCLECFLIGSDCIHDRPITRLADCVRHIGTTFPPPVVFLQAKAWGRYWETYKASRRCVHCRARKRRKLARGDLSSSSDSPEPPHCEMDSPESDPGWWDRM